MVSEIILYTTDDGQARIQLHTAGGTVWLTQLEMAALFQTTKQNIAKHLKAIFTDGELIEEAVVNKWLTTASDGKAYHVAHYNLDAILAVGYRVRSLRGIQFRNWAGSILKEYLVKGFAMDDDRLKLSDQWDYYDQWLARIRDIRASEKRFYQKVRDLFSTAVDYDKNSEQAKLFFKVVQNKMLWAVTGHTAAEIIADRASPDLPNMGLTSWQGRRVRKQDVAVAKNYLQGQELDALNRIVTMYLDYAENRALSRRPMTMREWAEKLDAFLQFNEQDILSHAGKISAAVAEKLATERYVEFDAKRREMERLEADAEDIRAIEDIGRRTEKKERRVALSMQNQPALSPKLMNSVLGAPNMTFTQDTLHTLMNEFGGKGCIFRGEPDFQLQFFEGLQALCGNVYTLEREYPTVICGEHADIDFILRTPEGILPIELKYKLIQKHTSIGNAQYLFSRDVWRIEQLLSSGQEFVPVGYAIFLTNDPRFWNPPRKESTANYREFKIYEGCEISGTRTWWDDKTMEKPHHNPMWSRPLSYKGSYIVTWQNYSVSPLAGIFRYTMIEINQPS